MMRDKMNRTAWALLVGLGAALGGGAIAVMTAAPIEAAGNCPAGDRIDGSTAEQAKRKFDTAGFRSAKELRKGCDNYWHAIAIKDGKSVRVVLSPTGEIMLEGE